MLSWCRGLATTITTTKNKARKRSAFCCSFTICIGASDYDPHMASTFKTVYGYYAIACHYKSTGITNFLHWKYGWRNTKYSNNYQKQIAQPAMQLPRMRILHKNFDLTLCKDSIANPNNLL